MTTLSKTIEIKTAQADLQHLLQQHANALCAVDVAKKRRNAIHQQILILQAHLLTLTESQP